MGHDNVMIWKHFPHYWPFVSKIHQSPVFSRHKGPLIRILDAFFVLSLDKLVKKTVEWVMNLDDTTLMWRHWMTCFVFRKPWCGDFFFYPRTVLTFGYCHCMRLYVCLCIRVCVYVCASTPKACPQENSLSVEARTTKFGKKIQKPLVKIPIVFG